MSASWISICGVIDWSGVAQAAPMQLLFHQAQRKLLFGLRLIVVALKLTGVIAKLLLGLLALGDVAYDGDFHQLVVEAHLADG